jgi:hypothetical protein
MAIGLHTEGTWVAANATTQVVTLPTHSTGDMLIIRAGMKHATLPGDITCDQGFTQIDEHNSGTTASSNGGGDVEIVSFWKEATSGAETNPTLTFHASTAATPSCAVATSFSKGAGEAWVTPVGDSGTIAAATNYSATMASHISATAGDWLVGFAVTNDNTTLTVPTIAQTGLTLAAVVESPAAALSSATSNDIAADGCYRVVNSGTSSAAAVFSGTNSVADLGAAMVIRLRVAAADTGDAEVATGTGAADNAASSLKARPVVSTVALRGSASVPAGDPTTSFTVAIDAAVVAGDWLYLAFLSRDHTVGDALPTVTDDDTGGNTWASIYTSGQRQAHVFRKKATSATASKTVTVAGCIGSSSGVLKAFTNTIGTTSNLQSEANASGNETHAGFVATEGGSMLAGIVFNTADDNAVTSLSFATAGATTMTEKLSIGGSDCAVAFGHVLATGSVSGDLTWTQTDGATISLVFAVLPDGPPVGVGAALDASVQTGKAVTAEVATATGEASGTTATVVANLGVATATGAATGTGPNVGATAQVSTATGEALDATVEAGTASTNAQAEVATATADALGTAAVVAPNAEATAATGDALGTDPIVAATSTIATATGAAADTDESIATDLEVATGTGAALDATVQAGTRASAGVATATGAAGDTDEIVAVGPATATATGEALEAMAAGGTRANAQVADASGSALDATAQVVAPVGAATATGTAHNASIVAGVMAAAATSTGNAEAAAIAVAVINQLPNGTGTAHDATVALGAVTVVAEVATAIGAAYDAQARTGVPGIVSTVVIRGGIASGTGIGGGIAVDPSPIQGTIE